MFVPYGTDAPIYHWPVMTVILIALNCLLLPFSGPLTEAGYALMLGDGLHHLLSIWGGGLVTIPHGLALTWVGGDGAHLSCGGNLPATAGLVGGVVWLAKRTVFDALVTRPSEPTVDPAE